ncbi:MAG: amylo-alpha-1,6-glucosidase [Pseudomonadota bacterium]
MIISESIVQHPEPGVQLLRFRGDTLVFSLTAPDAETGAAWVRTNIGRAGIVREEAIRFVQENLPPLARDWFDIPMTRRTQNRFEITLPLLEVGHFEAKCFFLKSGQPDPFWPPGPNASINVAPAHTCCANFIYNAFVRQFGPNKAGGATESDDLKRGIQLLDDRGYTVIPSSGTFRDLIAELDFIMGTLGCRIIQLLPIHPTPTTYARMGRFGSPYAALSFTGIDPALAQFDPHATPLEQFIELVDAIHQRHGKIILDIAVNHTGWAADLHETHPQWLDREPDGRINVPGAWGVRWEDLTKLNYAHKDLWQYMAEVFITWCRRGVDGFRCDAGYMIPVLTWKYIVAKVRQQYPDTIFFLEGLGGKISDTRSILNMANFNWAYSELFQNYTRQQIESYLPEAIRISESDGITVHYAETHDNPRLARKSISYARLRTNLCALFAPHGAFGFANGVEWLATEKIVVHQAPSLNWGASENQISSIRRLTTLLRFHPTFQDQTALSLVQTGAGNHVALLRHHRPTGKKILIIANLDENNEVLAGWDRSAFPLAQRPLTDLLTGEAFAIIEADGNPACRLGPSEVVCLTPDSDDLSCFGTIGHIGAQPIPRIVFQCLRAKAMDVCTAISKTEDIGSFDPDTAAHRLAENPEAFCRSLNSQTEESRVVRWQWPEDARRIVMIPPDHFLLVQCDSPFRARISDGNRTLAQEESLPTAGGRWFALFTHQETSRDHLTRTFQMTVYDPIEVDHSETPILFLARFNNLFLQRTLVRSDLERDQRMLLLTNGRGAMLRTPLLWGKLQSRYDALLSANPHPDFPVDRWMLFSRCRAWVIFQDYSQEIQFDCCHSFYRDDEGRGVWRFHVPTGQGEHVRLTIRMEMLAGENCVALTFYRHPSARRLQRLTDNRPVKLILRPDIEHRSFHAATKAYLGPENTWPTAVTARPGGFTFAPDPDMPLDLDISIGEFFVSPEWHYMVHRPKDAERGFDPDSDLFSPGYFQSELEGDKAIVLKAQTFAPGMVPISKPDGFLPVEDAVIYTQTKPMTPASAMLAALSDYTVRRGTLKTVIAGYPWFLDWGRDALIFSRGLIAAGRFQDAKDVLFQFGRFEKDGTLPNMIQGAEAANRDTSDAPLWFIVVVAELIRAGTFSNFPDALCGDRSIREILFSIANNYISGTPNGIQMDPRSGLIFSPAHFTWMDTNYPAGTPREGYAIEIQALWYHALDLLSKIDAQKKSRWRKLATLVRRSIQDLYFIEKEGFFSDCRHAGPGTPAENAEPDDALRPNQLFCITLGAIRDKDACRRVLHACETLLVPGAIRSLADLPVSRPLPIVHNGLALNNPDRPYIGRYAGDEDTQRKPAYHNGTAWTWPFPSFCEAWGMVYGKRAASTALTWLSSSSLLIARGCIGHLPEILDGDAPHSERGCDAQAWGASEWLRVWNKLVSQQEEDL